MQTNNLARHIDFKVSNWKRLVLPDSITDEQVKEILNKYIDIEDIIEAIIGLTKESLMEHTSPDSEEFLYPADNGNQPTVDFFVDGNSVWNNTYQKDEIIRKIRAIIEKYGSLSAADLELDSSLVHNSISKDHYILIEGYNLNTVKLVTYVHEMETDEDEIPYEDVSDNNLDEILAQVEQYVAEMDDLIDRAHGEK